MHDTLGYFALDPVHRKWHHDRLTFGLLYAFTENFVLPLSHDEVVHGKGSIVGKMPGDEWQRFANARACYAFMWAHPGKKLLFMGQEFGQTREWDFDAGLEWSLLQYPLHAGLHALVRDLNRAYATSPALHQRDCEAEGFQWIVVDDAEQSVYAWLRRGAPGEAPIGVICNFTPVPRTHYRIGLPSGGRWREVVNTDAREYGGSGVGNLGSVLAQMHPSHGFAASAEITIPPLAALYLEFVG
jgi:1,4-alpha-glucan branching enzyme